MSPLHRLLDRVLPPTGTHRGRRANTAPERIEVPLDSLLGPQLPAFVDVPHGAVAPQSFRYCPPCGGDVAVVLHPGDTHRCEAGHFTIPTTNGER
ncbi:hypothetical protein [Streptomyces cylindrosporus]|uniref:Uncharacterized protein n=1 Tax=Streptomyces cylindrosporus TaxID=2927583 RepID=A0ABS9Y2J5_9ACTN|nr:hypothetical protein [Streptomyces cylindrosporus]MCI3271431.1 hypothetical protein [Streptomyces cylindrosporus]